MTQSEHRSVSSPRIAHLASKLENKKYRHTYLAQHLATFLATQIRALRGKLTQKEFGKLIGKPQAVVSRLENESYGKLTLQTLLDIAMKLDIALAVRFVDFPTFLQITNDFSASAIAPEKFSEIVFRAKISALQNTLSSPNPRQDSQSLNRYQNPLEQLSLMKPKGEKRVPDFQSITKSVEDQNKLVRGAFPEIYLNQQQPGQLV